MANSTKLHAMPWVGGKSAAHATGVGAWVNSLLPAASNKIVYVEPFAGMLGVLLQREAAGSELVSDTNKRIVNWWTQIRENSEKLIHLIENTPYSREQYTLCRELMDDDDRLKAAWAFTIVITQCFTPSDEGSPTWITPPVNAHSPKDPHGIVKRIPLLKERIKRVALENKPAELILERYVDVKEAVIYCDPPYPSARSNLYQHPEIDVDRMSELLLAAQGRVAISGVGVEWDHLGWARSSLPVRRSMRAHAGSSDVDDFEILWTNYDTDSVASGRVQQMPLAV